MTDPTNTPAASGGKQKQTYGGKAMKIGIFVSAAVAIAGIALWIWQMTSGLVLTNMRNTDSWGLYLTSFMFLVGLSAGGLIISSAPRLFGFKGFGGISKVAVWTSICCTILAVAFVVIDLGQPMRLWELFIYSNFSSPLMWDIAVISIYLILSIIYLWATLRTEKGKGSEKALRVLSAIAFITAILVHSVTAWIFGLQQAHEMWNTALLAPWFVSSALVCGVALVLVVVIALRKTGYLDVAQENIVKMLKLLGVFIAVDLYFFACDLLTEAFPGGDGMHVVEMLTTGALAPFFWVEIIGCIIAMTIAFIPRLRTNPLIVLASVLAMVAIFCKRVQIMVGGFQIQNIDLASSGVGTPLTDAGAATQALGGAMVYFPSPLEFGVLIGVFGLGVFLLLAGLRYLPLAPTGKSH